MEPVCPLYRVFACARELLKELGRGWELNGNRHVVRCYTFKNFAQALAFANKVGAVAEAEGHHPDLYLAWGKCKIEVWSHRVWLEQSFRLRRI